MGMRPTVWKLLPSSEIQTLAPPQVAFTPPVPANRKTVLLAVPWVKPLTGPSKVTVSTTVSPALLPAVPAMVVKAVLGGLLLLSVGPVLSMTIFFMSPRLLPTGKAVLL